MMEACVALGHFLAELRLEQGQRSIVLVVTVLASVHHAEDISAGPSPTNCTTTYRGARSWFSYNSGEA